MIQALSATPLPGVAPADTNGSAKARTGYGTVDFDVLVGPDNNISLSGSCVRFGNDGADADTKRSALQKPFHSGNPDACQVLANVIRHLGHRVVGSPIRRARTRLRESWQ
jgi:hypothetical protein